MASEVRGEGALLSPAGVAVDRKGNVYASDDERHLVLRLAADGAVEELARGGPAIGAVVQPAGLDLGVVDGSDSLVVSDAGNGRVQVMGSATAPGVRFLAGRSPGRSTPASWRTAPS